MKRLLSYKKYVIKKSDIGGQGIFTVVDIPKDYYIGLAISKINNTQNTDDDYIRTNLGKFTNHSDKPNMNIIKNKGDYYYITNKDIHKGEELTVDYNQFDFDGKKDFIKSEEY